MVHVRDYWRNNSIYSISFTATVMARDRYRTISWNLHMSELDEEQDNDKKRGTPDYDPLFLVKPLMDIVWNACKASCHPWRSLAVEERTTQARHDTGQTNHAGLCYLCLLTWATGTLWILLCTQEKLSDWAKTFIWLCNVTCDSFILRIWVSYVHWQFFLFFLQAQSFSGNYIHKALLLVGHTGTIGRTAHAMHTMH